MFTQLRQGDESFSVWYPKVREQAGRYDFENYNEVQAAIVAILFLTSNSKIQQKVLAEYIDFDKTIKYGLPLEQSRFKTNNINASRGERTDVDRVARLEGQLRTLKAGCSSTTNLGQRCKICTHQTHGPGMCPGKKVDCFEC